MQQADGCGEDRPDAAEVYGHVDGLVVVGGVEGELLLQVEHVAAERHPEAGMRCPDTDGGPF